MDVEELEAKEKCRREHIMLKTMESISYTLAFVVFLLMLKLGGE